jgi:hypothetical protein
MEENKECPEPTVNPHRVYYCSLFKESFYTVWTCRRFGVKCRKKIQKGQLFLSWIPGSVRVQGEDDLEREKKKLGWKWDYAIQLSDDSYLAPIEDRNEDIGNLCYLVNAPELHQSPNTIVVETSTDDVCYQALRDIHAGEELLLDYGSEYWEERTVNGPAKPKDNQVVCSICNQYVGIHNMKKHSTGHRLRDKIKGKILYNKE